MNNAELTELLKGLVAIPSLSRQEKDAADYLQQRLAGFGLEPVRKGNNLWIEEEGRGDGRPVILLNAHIDTVKPAEGYSRDPFTPVEDGDIIYGLGTNDDGASLVALLEAYVRLLPLRRSFRMIWSATAEEEVCGEGGLDSILPELGKIDLAIVGEPTGMKMAVAEKGLIVLDCTARGKSGHAARNEGENAIYNALRDIDWFRTHSFERVSDYLGAVKMSVTMISAGTQHNVVPDNCRFVVDIRPNGLYSNAELMDIIRGSVSCEVVPRSLRHGSSHIDADHPVVKRAGNIGIELFGSPTTSNQTLLDFPSVKIGPGDSARSHTADEYILKSEIAGAVDVYVELLEGLEL
ncbi:MAG: M20/M25/M40 family metallo-hydrolase [Candidatus Cryptobacteroides sp.]|nr:M20/M25/M40 family metallo-hydrolase [Candidatus Cryptobacteroides sp.]